MKLAIISRDGYKYHKFIENNNLKNSHCIRVKKLSDIINKHLSGFVIIPPVPYNYEEILEYLELEEFPNLTKKYII